MPDLLKCGEYLSLLSIRTKERRLVPLVLNEPQQRLYDRIVADYNAGRPVRLIILKARQMGFSTLSEAILFWATATAENTHSLIVAHTEDATANLFKMTKRYYESLPEPLRPMRAASNAQELVFDRGRSSAGEGAGLNSRIRCATAGGQGVGRSDTIQNAHLSEFAYWNGDKKATFAGIMQAVPDLPGTIVIVESTANGYDEFKELWDRSVEKQARGDTDGFTPLFFPWHEMRSYRRPAPPDFEATAQERELAERYGLDDEQLCWRRWCIETNCMGDEDTFRQEYPASPDEAFRSTGCCVFDQDALISRREALRRAPPPERGVFEFTYDEAGHEKLRDIRFRPRRDGPLRILSPPEPGVPYVIGGDTAGTGSDCFVAQVLDNRSGRQVAVLQHRLDEDVFARQLYCLGRWYNDALIAVETNYSTHPQRQLEWLGYNNFYVRERVDSFTGALTEAYGFETTVRTRPLIIDGLKSVVRQAPELLTDDATLGEMLSFVYDGSWKPQARPGQHDDLVMALAIAHFIRPQQRLTAASKTAKPRWSPSVMADFRACRTAEERRALRAALERDAETQNTT